MKTVTCKFSDEFVAEVIEVGRIFGADADFGHILEHYGGRVFEALSNDPDALMDEVEARTWDTEQEAREVASRAAAKFPDDLTGFRVQPSESEPDRWEIRFTGETKEEAA